MVPVGIRRCAGSERMFRSMASGPRSWELANCGRVVLTAFQNYFVRYGVCGFVEAVWRWCFSGSGVATFACTAQERVWGVGSCVMLVRVLSWGSVCRGAYMCVFKGAWGPSYADGRLTCPSGWRACCVRQRAAHAADCGSLPLQHRLWRSGPVLQLVATPQASMEGGAGISCPSRNT